MKKLWFPLILFLASTGVSIWAYPKLPEMVPIHWGINGEPDREASRLFAVGFVPAVMIFVYGLIKIMYFIAPPKKNAQAMKKSVDIILSTTLLTIFIVHCLLIANGLGYNVNMSLVGPLVTGIVFIVIGNYLPRFKQNYVAGIRLPWTLNNEEVWNRTHRFSSRVFFIGGFLILASALLPTLMQTIVFVALTVIICVISAGSAYYFHKQNS
jgi:uncharacterized membrane protein